MFGPAGERYLWAIELEPAMTLAYPLSDPRTARPASALTEVFDRHGVRMTYDRNEEIYAQDDAVELLYQVVRGVVRTSRLTVEGRRSNVRLSHPIYGEVARQRCPATRARRLLAHLAHLVEDIGEIDHRVPEDLAALHAELADCPRGGRSAVDE